VQLYGKFMTGYNRFHRKQFLGDTGTRYLYNVGGKLGIQDTNPPQKLHIDEVAGMDVGTGSFNKHSTIYTR